jgi:hypothetical protein
MTSNQIKHLEKLTNSDVNIHIPGDAIECTILKNTKDNKTYLIESIYTMDANWKNRAKKRPEHFTVTANDYGWNEECYSFRELEEMIKEEMSK